MQGPQALTDINLPQIFNLTKKNEILEDKGWCPTYEVIKFNYLHEHSHFVPLHCNHSYFNIKKSGK